MSIPLPERAQRDPQDPSSYSSPKEKFDVLYGMLKQTQEWLIDFEFKQGAFLFIVLGWTVSSDKAQAFFRAHPSMQLGMTALMLGLTSFHAYWVYMHYVRSRAVHRRLVGLDYMPLDYYEPQRVHRFLVVSFGASHLLISSIIIAAVWLS